jgi:amino acid transporter
MKNPLESIWGTIISGLVLTAILYAVVHNVLM